MEVIIRSTPEEAIATAVRTTSRLLREKPEAVPGPATGSAPLLLYRELVRLHREQRLDFSKITAFNLEECGCLDPKHKAQAVAGAVEDPIAAMNPAPSLQLLPRTNMFPDAGAASVLQPAEYYQSVYDHNLDWQKDARKTKSPIR